MPADKQPKPDIASRPVLRFAPSPNGELHTGHALSALINQEMASRLGGRLLLRIEDIDIGRTREAFIEAIYRDLEWLGIAWESPVRRQSEHFADYVAAARRLEEMGVLYACFASRAEIEAAARDPGSARDPDGAPLYPGLHRGLGREDIARRRAAGEKPAMRLDMAAALELLRERGEPALTYASFDADLRESNVVADPARWGDVVIQRKDVPTSYHLSVVVDDALQGVSHVVRGRDLEASTDVHRVLQALLGLPAPRYHHHRLITDADGRKLAKSRGDTSLRQFRESGVTADEVRTLVGA